MNVGLIGAGNMARAMARGWGDPVLCSDAGSGRAQALVAELGGRAVSNVELAREAEIVFLCCKPAQFEAVASEIRDDARIVASVLSGVGVQELQAGFPGRPVFRLVPNTPVEVGRGVICYAPAPDVNPAAERTVLDLCERLGSVISMLENQLGPAGALMGVGPAYQALLAEAQVDAGVRRGLPALLASRLVVETMSGSAALITERNYDTLAVRREVTSPGGTTAQGLAALERAGVRGAFHNAMDAVTGWTR